MAIVNAKEEHEFMSSLKKGDPVLIINPCDLSWPDILNGQLEDIDNPYNQD